jgi:hypothetical protein
VESYNVVFHNVDTLYDFFDLLFKRKHVYRCTNDAHRFSFTTNIPWIPYANLAGMAEDTQGLQLVVAIEIRRIFREEELYPDFPHRNWFFPTWRRLQQNDQLTRALAFFFNSLDGDFTKVAAAMAALKRRMQDAMTLVMVKSGELNLAIEDFEVVQTELAAVTRNYQEANQRLLWCKLFYVIERYLNYDGSTEGGD